MPTSLSIFLRSFLYYAILILPSLILPIMYVFALGFAAAVGWIAGLVFMTLYWLIGKTSFGPTTKFYLLIVVVWLSVLAAFPFIEIFGLFDHIWALNYCLLFPIAAAIAGTISVCMHKQQILAAYHPGDFPTFEMLSS